MAAWYATKTCEVCQKLIGNPWFFQGKPRLVNATAQARDCAYVDEAAVPELMRTHVLVCPSCYSNRFGDVKALAEKRAKERG